MDVRLTIRRLCVGKGHYCFVCAVSKIINKAAFFSPWTRASCYYSFMREQGTKFLILGAPKDVKKLPAIAVKVGDEAILPSKTARNIGAYMDPALELKEHVANMVKSCYFQLRSIAKIRKFLTESSAIKLCHAFITSRLDCLNSLLYKIPKYMLEKLQKIQNNTARLILRLKKADHITPALVKLHWLPIPERIQYKILLLVYKALNQKGPRYLADMLIPHQPTRALRSSSQHLLKEQKTQKLYGDRAFINSGPYLWNRLKPEIRRAQSVGVFKSKLKTHLFSSAFNSQQC